MWGFQIIWTIGTAGTVVCGGVNCDPAIHGNPHMGFYAWNFSP